MGIWVDGWIVKSDGSLLILSEWTIVRRERTEQTELKIQLFLLVPPTSRNALQKTLKFSSLSLKP